MLVYVAGPLGVGNTMPTVQTNIDNALLCSRVLLKLGLTPICPHLMYYGDFFHLIPATKDEAMDWRLGLLKHCDAVIRLPGESEGATIEVDFARENDIMVYEIKKEISDEELDELLKEVFK